MAAVQASQAKIGTFVFLQNLRRRVLLFFRAASSCMQKITQQNFSFQYGHIAEQTIHKTADKIHVHLAVKDMNQYNALICF